MAPLAAEWRRVPAANAPAFMAYLDSHGLSARDAERITDLSICVNNDRIGVRMVGLRYAEMQSPGLASYLTREVGSDDPLIVMDIGPNIMVQSGCSEIATGPHVAELTRLYEESR